jgi:hypothetical protein
MIGDSSGESLEHSCAIEFKGMRDAATGAMTCITQSNQIRGPRRVLASPVPGRSPTNESQQKWTHHRRLASIEEISQDPGASRARAAPYWIGRSEAATNSTGGAFHAFRARTTRSSHPDDRGCPAHSGFRHLGGRGGGIRHDPGEPIRLRHRGDSGHNSDSEQRRGHQRHVVRAAQPAGSCAKPVANTDQALTYAH